MNDKDLIAIREAELVRLRRQVELQERTIETMRGALGRKRDRPRVVNVGPRLETAEGKRASPPVPEVAAAPGWPSARLPKSRLSPPPGLAAYSLAGAKAPVTAFAVFGLEGGALEQAVANVSERQRTAMNFVPLFLTDSADHEPFRRRGYVFEHFPEAVYGDVASALAFQERLLVAWKKWAAGSLIDIGAGDYLSARLAGTRIPDFVEATAVASIGAKQSTTNASRRKPTIAERLESKLWGGFSRSALRDLEKLSWSRGDPTDRFGAAWALARWHAARGEKRRTLDQIALMRALKPKEMGGRHIVLLEVECLTELGAPEEAQSLLDVALRSRRHFDADLCLAYANVVSVAGGPKAEREQLAWINRLFAEEGLAELEKRDAGQPLTIDNIVAPTAHRADVPNAPKVSVIMPAFNAAKTIATAIESILAQTWPNLELIVVDDHSADDTTEIARAMARGRDSIIPIRLGRNQGANSARNKGLSVAKGDFITVHDADDWSHPQKIEAQIRSFVRSHGVVGNLSAWVRVLPDMRFRWEYRPGSRLIDWNTSSFMVGREIAVALGNWVSDRNSGDTEFIWRAQRRGAVDRILSTVPLSFSRLSPTSLTQSGVTHIKTIHFGMRREYREAARHWHDSQQQPSELVLQQSTESSVSCARPNALNS